MTYKKWKKILQFHSKDEKSKKDINNSLFLWGKIIEVTILIFLNLRLEPNIASEEWPKSILTPKFQGPSAVWSLLHVVGFSTKDVNTQRMSIYLTISTRILWRQQTNLTWKLINETYWKKVTKTEKDKTGQNRSTTKEKSRRGRRQKRKIEEKIQNTCKNICRKNYKYHNSIWIPSLLHRPCLNLCTKYRFCRWTPVFPPN